MTTYAMIVKSADIDIVQAVLDNIVSSCEIIEDTVQAQGAILLRFTVKEEYDSKWRTKLMKILADKDLAQMKTVRSLVKPKPDNFAYENGELKVTDEEVEERKIRTWS